MRYDLSPAQETQRPSGKVCAHATLTGAGFALYAGRVFVWNKKGDTHGRIRVFFWFDAALLS